MNNFQKVVMITVAVKDMPKMKEFCTGILGAEITREYRQDDANWWTPIKFPGGGPLITLSTFTAGSKLGTPGLYLLTSDIEAAHKDASAKGANVTPIQENLYGPGSDVQWFGITDPDGNMWQIAAAEPFGAQ